MCSLFDNRIYWRLSPAIMGGVKYIASSRPDVNRIRRTISLSNRRPLGDRTGGLLANPLRVKLTSASSSQQSLNYYPLSSASLADHPAVHRIFLFPHSFARNAEKSQQWLQGQGIGSAPNSWTILNTPPVVKDFRGDGYHYHMFGKGWISTEWME